MLLARDGQIAEAQRQLEILEGNTPGSWTLAYLSGLLATADGRPGDAKGFLEKAFEAHPTRQTMLALAHTEEQTGRMDESVAIREEWLAANPDDLGSRLALADTYLKLKRIPEAMSQYERVLEQDKDNPLALNNLAWYQKESAPQQALEFAERAYALAPDQVPVADTLAAIFIALERFQDAERVLSAALDANPASSALKYRSALLSSRTGKKVEAARRLEELLAEGTDFPEREQVSQLLKELRGH
jgi:tetratricopeptide (TPR) repeat protein